MERWRLLDIETPSQPEMNLAIDEAVFLEKIKSEVPPTVRFWRNRKAVVIGYSQNAEAEVNLALCRSMGIKVLRRISGGGAVYHDLGNLNYSIILQADHHLVKGLDIIGSYEFFSRGIIMGLKDLGLEAVFSPPSDIMVRGRKVSGNAQSRKRGVILHHGTLLVKADLDLLTKILDTQQGGILLMKVTSRKKPVTNLVDELGHCLTIDTVKEFLKRGFESVFSVKLVRGNLTLDEKKIVETLYRERYSRCEWNFFR